MLYGVGSVGGVLQQLAVEAGLRSVLTLGVALNLLLPADPLYREAAWKVVRGGGSVLANFLGPAMAAATPSVLMLAWAGLYVLGTLGLALWMFSRRDL